MNRVDVTNKADIRAILGSTGTGKSHYTKAEIKKAKRVMIWDMGKEYEDIQSVGLSELGSLLGHRSQRKLRYLPPINRNQRTEDFEEFCRIALAAGNVLVVVEELRFVTEPSRSPDRWAELTLTGRKFGVKIIGTSQRPASIDKDFLGNATYIRCGSLAYPPDRAAVAAVVGCEPSEIAKLEGYSAINWQQTPRKVWKT